MSKLRETVRRHSWGLTLVAALLPLVTLLVLQYRSLVRLESASALADQATLDYYLEKVNQEIQTFYRGEAERSLRLPASAFLEGCPEQGEIRFRNRPVVSARRLFLVSFVGPTAHKFFFFSPKGEPVEVSPDGAEARAVFVAASAWSLVGKKGIPIAPAELAVDERDPANRVLVQPITQPYAQDTERVVGVAGMVIDERYFVGQVLPAAIHNTLPKFFASSAAGAPAVTVRGTHGETVFTTCDLLSGPGGEDAVLPLSFIFRDWRVALDAGRYTPKKLARSNFLLNLSISALAGLGLLLGVALALRTAARAVWLSRLKSDFVSNVSHELRTPLASIRVFGELLALGRAPGPEKVREYGSRIEAESRRLTGLIDNLLDFSRLESGRKTFDFERADLTAITADVLDSFAPRFEELGFQVQRRGFEAPLPAVEADVSALGQVLHNLIDNAIKYSKERREITVALARSEDGVTVAVADRGIGIAKADQRRIFERFHRVATGLVHDVKGSGLGLALVDQIVRAHRGRVSVESELGGGSTFTVTLPVVPGASADALAPGAELPARSPLPEAGG